MLFILYKFLTFLFTPFAPRLLHSRLKNGKEKPEFVSQKIGIYHNIGEIPENLIWFHVASVGEASSILPLVNLLIASQKAVLITSGTITSQEFLKAKKLSNTIICHAPLDCAIYIKRFFNHFKPKIGIFVESEVWPNLISFAKKRCKKLISLNTRFSPKSLKLWQKFPRTFYRIFSQFDFILPQDKKLSQDLSDLFGINTSFIGNLKYDISCNFEAFSRPDWAVNRKILLLASTHPTEEEQLISAIDFSDPNLLVILCPRHPHRMNQILSIVPNAKVLSKSELPSKEDQIFIWDKIGDMMFLYWLCDAAFVAGSIKSDIGGHNVLEPAFFEKPIAVGPFYNNWIGVMEQMIKENCLVKSDDFKSAIKKILYDDCRDMAQNAKRFCTVHSGATKKAFEIINNVL